ncbi:zinc ribbon domain-containing protein [Desulfitobacterium chlororespirans]|uniref:Regulatory protein, FmdB family n=1 Tax=Desulfitobacterium chlororespirans DSM 11544 TaxID=1121395 RepID=A0A1M7RVU2_9FIRM|nr:zinc ribbon domain-containing protein [Desulfitobacterium chlororespirans]SHN50276.1 hypothetical protein SAMN02745215_00160 [Desulfitobacterium chlororespirans DSM 11544]
MKECNGYAGCNEVNMMGEMAELDEVPSNRFPEYTMLCESCRHEFKLEASEEDIEKAVCPACQSAKVRNLYISFPEDGPGFKKKVSGFSFGGCN